MSGHAAERLVDARGQGRIRLLADDPVAPGEIAALCAERGWTLIDGEGAFLIEIGGS